MDKVKVKVQKTGGGEERELGKSRKKDTNIFRSYKDYQRTRIKGISMMFKAKSVNKRALNGDEIISKGLGREGKAGLSKLNNHLS